MAGWLTRALGLRPGETSRLGWVAATGLGYAAATSLADDVAQALFMARAGAAALPRMFLLKGLVDVLAAALYLPLSRAAPVVVGRGALVVYLLTLLAARGVLGAADGVVGAYALYVGHECAWTILTIHWGVLVLDAFDAEQARRLFPLLFTLARLGGVVAGVLLRARASAWGTENMLFVAAGCALGAYLSPLSRRGEVDEPAPRSRIGTVAGWREAAGSPLIRAIALSTAAMVLVRFGLHLVSLDTITASFGGDDARVAEFLGTFGAFANLAGIALGVVAVPWLLGRFGPGFANVLYAALTLLSFALLLVAPSLASAAAARFTQAQLKDALKTPLSALFYGAERPRRRELGRAFVFGAVIPLATAITAGVLEMCKLGPSPMRAVVLVGLAAAGLFVAACLLQNRRWRSASWALLDWRLERHRPPDPDRVDAIQQRIAAAGRASAGHHPPARSPAPTWGRGTSESLTPERTLALAGGLASADPETRALAAELLAESLPRRAARALAEQELQPIAAEPRNAA